MFSEKRHGGSLLVSGCGWLLSPTTEGWWGFLLACRVAQIVTASKDGSARVWRADNGECRGLKPELGGVSRGLRNLDGHKAWVRWAAFCPGKQRALGLKLFFQDVFPLLRKEQLSMTARGT